MQRRQSLKVVISEAIMVLTVIITVAVLALVVSGYWINSDFKVERQGMLQISSVPTGADIMIDDDTAWLQRTNTSKVLPSGEHTVSLSKSGYDSWSKTITIKEGLLYKIHYPRLFLLDRSSEKSLKTTGTTHAFTSSSHSDLILTNNTTKWQYLDLSANEIKPKTIDISAFFSNVSLAENAEAGLFSSEITEANWDYDANHVLFAVKNNDKLEWVLLDIKNPTNSLNLSKEFGSDFSNVQILDNSANTLLAVQNGNLHKIDVPHRQISSILVADVINFDHFDNEIIFTAKDKKAQEDTTLKYYVGYLKLDHDQIEVLTKITSPALVAITEFYDQKYFTIIADDSLSVYTKDDLKEIIHHNLQFTPNKIKVGHNGEFIVASKDRDVATLDMEAAAVREWTIEGESYNWLDNDMIYTVNNGELIIYDFDGLNQRTLAKNVSSHLPVSITENKWLYYFSDDYLIREWIVEH